MSKGGFGGHAALGACVEGSAGRDSGCGDFAALRFLEWSPAAFAGESPMTASA